MSLFGTDGIRGEYGGIICENTAYKLGRVATSLLSTKQPLIIIGQDSRWHGKSLVDSFCQGACEEGAEIINIGVLPTNAVSFMTRAFGADMGIMVTASHNPPKYNGFKLFDKYGAKICKQRELEISQAFSSLNVLCNKHIEFDALYTAKDIYIEYILNRLKTNLTGLQILIDCVNGCASNLAKSIFLKCGANCDSINDSYDGFKINVSCNLFKHNKEFDNNKIDKSCYSATKQHIHINTYDYDIAFSYDGDADRLSVFEKGHALSGEQILYCITKYYLEKQLLRKNVVVGTYVTNGGLENALNNLHIIFLRSDIGDRNVFEMMVKSGAEIGGESSGHYIISKYALGSDAIMNSLIVACIYKEKGSLIDYCRELKLLNTYSKNIKVADNIPLEIIDSAINNTYILIAEQKLINKKHKERCIIRKSGTENLIRVFVEGMSECLDEKVEVIEQVIKEFINKYKE